MEEQCECSGDKCGCWRSVNLDMNKKKTFLEVEIDKLTNSIENRTTGEVFDTKIIPLIDDKKKQIKKREWLFDWHEQFLYSDRAIYKLTVAGVAFACKKAFERGYEGYVSFFAKSKLIKHYELTLGAQLFSGTKMFIDTRAALNLTNKYFGG